MSRDIMSRRRPDIMARRARRRRSVRGIISFVAAPASHDSLMVRSAAKPRVSNHGPSTQAAPHRPPSSFETRILATRERAPQDEAGPGLSLMRRAALGAG